MAIDETGTYAQAKYIFDNADKDAIIKLTIASTNAAFFRKHLAEMIWRKKSSKKFTTRILDENQIMVVRTD